MTRRVRIIRVTVQVEAVLDDTDTDTLTPLQTATVTYAAGDWPLFDLEQVRATLQQRVEAELAGAPDDTPATRP
jgi:hypothetical protein